MIINKPELIENGSGRVRVRTCIETREGEQELWYELDAKYRDYLVLDRLDAFVTAMIPYAMQTNEEMVVEGTLSGKLAQNLEYYMHVMKVFYPDSHVVPLKISKRDPLLQHPRGPAVGASFTMGVDSFCTLWKHYKKSEGDTNRITHLLYFFAGQRGWKKFGGRALFNENLKVIQEAAKRLNLELLVIDSNLDSFYPGKFSDTHGARLSSCVLLLQKLFSIYYIPSSYQYFEFKPHGSTPLGDPLLSTEILDIVHDGAQYSRVEKIKMISEWDITKSFLMVCAGDMWEGKINCSKCEKCLRTMVTLDMLGFRRQFEQVFDFTDFENKRDIAVCNAFISNLVGIDDYVPFWKEIKKHAKRAGYPWRLKPEKLPLAIWLKISRNPSMRIKRLSKRWKLKLMFSTGKHS